MSHLPPECSIDGKQGEQCHAGHSTANHKGDRGGACQLQGLGEMSRCSDGSLGEGCCRGAPGLRTPCLVQTGTCIFITATHRRGLTIAFTRAWSRPMHTCGGICVLSHPHSRTYNQTRTCVYMHTTAHCHTPSGTCHHCEHHPRGTDFHVQPQKCSCLDTRVGSHRSLLTVADGHWQPRHLLPAHPRHLPLTRSLGGWASTAKVDRCWHWQRVCAAWVSSVWQLSVSQSPELASLGWVER